MPLTEKQRDYLLHANRRWNIKTGATGSGKSYVDIAATIPKRLLRLRGEGLAVMLGNTRGTLERNILDPMRQLWPGLVGPIQSNNTARMFGRRVYVLGADNKKHVARIQGATIEWAYGDEMTTWSEDVMQMLKSRLRCNNSHFDGTCNPAGPKHWVKQMLDSDLDIFHQHYTIDDNPFLPPAFVDNLRREYAGTVYYSRFIDGLWVAAEGAIYRPFVDAPGRFMLDTPPPIASAAIGVDFGGGTSAHAFSCVGFTPGLTKMALLAEWYCKDALDPDKLGAAFVDFVRMCQRQWLVTDAYCDSAEQTLIRGLRVAVARARVGINVRNAMKRQINDRIRALCILMASGRFGIMRTCTNTIDAIESAVWDGRYPTQDVRLDDGTTNVDSLDAMEYAFERLIPSLVDRGVTV